MLGKLLLTTTGVVASYIAYSAACPISQNWGRGFHRGPRGNRQIALTFDDGPSESTLDILAVLELYGISATFFCCGANVDRLPEISKATVVAGHEIGNHSYSHPPLLMHSKDYVRQELQKTQLAIQNATGKQPHLFRPPYGLRTPSLTDIQSELDLTVVLWSVIGQDWHFSKKRIVQRVTRRIEPGGIICLHDGDTTNLHADRRETIQALPEIIETILEMGYSFVTAGEMLQQLETKTDNWRVHKRGKQKILR